MGDTLDRPKTDSDSPGVPSRLKFFLTGCLMPLICIIFVTAFRKGHLSVNEPWQSGDLEHYVTFLVEWPGIGPFLPLIGYSMVCLATFCVRPQMRDRMWLQIGLAGGVVLSLQFLIFICILTVFATFVFAAMVGPAIALTVFIGSLFVRRQFTIQHLMILTTVIAVIAAFFSTTQFGRESFALVVNAISLLVLGATPTLNFITYTRSLLNSTNMGRNIMPTQRGLGIGILVAWIVAWIVGWRMAVQIMLAEYAKLPTTDPNCFVSSAAARGHKRWVGRESDGVNQQMQRLKFLEFALAAAWPSLHRNVRSVYNQVGPPLAEVCARNRWFADLTFAILKPLEWLAVLTRIVAEIPCSSVQRIYRR